MSVESDKNVQCVENDIQTKIFTVQNSCGRPVGPIELFRNDIQKCFPSNVVGYNVPLIGKVDHENLRIDVETHSCDDTILPKSVVITGDKYKKYVKFPIKHHQTHPFKEKSPIYRESLPTQHKPLGSNNNEHRSEKRILRELDDEYEQEWERIRKYHEDRNKRRYTHGSNYDQSKNQINEPRKQSREDLIYMFNDDEDNVRLTDDQNMDLIGQKARKYPERFNKHIGSVKYNNIVTKISKPKEPIKIPEPVNRKGFECAEQCKTCIESMRINAGKIRKPNINCIRK